MLEKVLEQISAYIKANNFKAAIETLSSVISILFQINKQRLQQYSPNALKVIGNLLIMLDQHFANPLERLKQYERVLALLERFNEQSNKNTDLIDLQIRLQRLLGEQRTRQTITPYKPLPTPPKTAPVRFDHRKALNFQTGITHLIQALHTAESNQRSKEITDCHQNITNLFIDLFQTFGSYWIRQRENLVDQLRDNLHTAQRQGLTEFNKIWDETNSHIDTFCIFKLFDEARKILCYEVTSDNNRAQDFNSDKILESLSNINSQQLNPTQQKSFTSVIQNMRKSLETLRMRGYSSLNEPIVIRQIQNNFTADYKNLIRQLLNFVTDIIGSPPEGICILGHGSLAYGLPRSKSDVDYKILENIKNKLTLEYAQDKTFLWRIIVSIFGEDTGNQPGFHLDDKDKSVDKETSGIYTVEEFSKYLSADVIAEDVSNLNATFLFGDESLYRKYQNAIPQLTREQVKPLLTRTLHDFQKLSQYWKKSRNENVPILEYLKPLIALIIRLALWYGLPKLSSYHPSDVLMWLCEQDILEAEFTYECINKLNLVYQYQLELEYQTKNPAIKTQQTLDKLKYFESDVIDPFLVKLRTLMATEDNILTEQKNAISLHNRKKFITEFDFSILKVKPDQLLKWDEPSISLKLRIINCEILNDEKLRKLLKSFPQLDELTLKNISHIGANGKLIEIILECSPNLKKLHLENLTDFVLKKPSIINDQFCLIIKNCNGVDKAVIDSLANSKGIKLRMAAASINLDKYTDAISHYNTVVQLDPTNEEALINRGIAKSRLNFQVEALQDFDKAIKVNPNNATAHFTRGNRLHELKRLEEARDALQKAHTLDPKSLNILNNLGLVLYDLKEYMNAINAYMSATKINKDDYQIHFNFGLACYALGFYEQAKDCFTCALMLNTGLNSAKNMIEDCERRIIPASGNSMTDVTRRSFAGQ